LCIGFFHDGSANGGIEGFLHFLKQEGKSGGIFFFAGFAEQGTEKFIHQIPGMILLLFAMGFCFLKAGYSILVIFVYEMLQTFPLVKHVRNFM
jgi:hypothetical protein